MEIWNCIKKIVHTDMDILITESSNKPQKGTEMRILQFPFDSLEMC